MQMIHQRLVTPGWSTNEASLWGNLASTPVLCRDETPRVSDLGPSALSSGIPDDSLLIAGGLQLPSHFPKGGAPEWNLSGDLVPWRVVQLGPNVLGFADGENHWDLLENVVLHN